jgi:uncharacterized protein YkwD
LTLEEVAMSWLDIVRSWFRPKPNPRPPVNPPPATDLIAALNAERARAGREHLVESAVLDDTALDWARSMAASGTLSHGDFIGRIAAVMPGRAAAENIAEGQTTVAQVVATWMNSPGHRANILGPYRQAGHGEAMDAHMVRYWVVDFAS